MATTIKVKRTAGNAPESEVQAMVDTMLATGFFLQILVASSSNYLYWVWYESE